MIAVNRWPTWQQAGVAMLLCLLGVAIARRRRPSKATEIALPALSELAVLTGLYALWRTARKLPLVQSEGAIERARSIVDIQEAMGLPRELTLQEFVLGHDWLGWLSAAYYAGMHVPALFVFLIWMFWRHRERYGRWRNVLALTTAGCLLIRFWRVAPPRFLPDLGYIDLSEKYGMSVYGRVGTGVSGQFVAMPSIHVAWAGVIGLGIISSSTSRWKWLFAAHLAITVFVVSATGHHWWLDGIVALGLVLLAVVIDEVARRLLATWRGGREMDEHGPGAAIRAGVTAGVTREQSGGPTSERGADRREQVVEVGHRPEPGELGDHVVG